ncbi:hypothetical protein CTAYLR_001752 [Chrysophaeum taylorii]|uniref:HSF-type DNA-binding domain-containing protein n=1 Tax=Chrysophaeum taylorii TaxID=2483200 RepID=A0AAD7UEY4_9STRA|nr:hypothetical protein CTAYLR_001752 [Chrysophaeum taylorii]
MSGHQNPVPFAKALYRMIKEHPEVISWDSSTGSIVIPDPKALEKTLVEYFRHGRYASFQRQLNNFGYRRVGSPGQATVYRRWATSERETDLSPESILSLRHVLRRSAGTQGTGPTPKFAPAHPPTRPLQPHPDFHPRRPTFQPMPPPPPAAFHRPPPERALPMPPPSPPQHRDLAPQQQQQAQRPEMPPPRRLERFDSLSSIFNQPPALAAHALLSLKAQPV